MAQEILRPRDVGDLFYFKQSRKLEIEESKTEIPSTIKSSLVCSSRFGLVFVAFSKGIKIFQLDDILNLNDSQSKRTNATCEELKFQQINLNSYPVHVALSCDDLSLAICYIANDGCCQANIYDVRAFANKDTLTKPYSNIRLTSTPDNDLVDFLWSPTQCEVFAACLANGSVFIYEVKESSLNVSASLQNAQATAICWSPKGKQLVTGRSDGCLVQYKLNLQPAKTIPAPTILQDPHSVSNVCWLSSFQFAVVYVKKNGIEPSFIVVNTPKGANVMYVNYEDPLMCSGNSNKPNFYMNHISGWGLLIMASNISIETAVFGQNADKSGCWEQWMLEDTGRAELPMMKQNESYATGMVVSYAAQKQLQIDNQKTMPAMPVLLLMSTVGVLCPFHIVNANQGAASLTKPSELLKSDGMRTGIVCSNAESQVDGQKVESTTDSVAVGTMITSTPKPAVTAAKKNLMSSFGQTTAGLNVANSDITFNNKMSMPIPKQSLPSEQTVPASVSISATPITAASTITIKQQVPKSLNNAVLPSLETDMVKEQARNSGNDEILANAIREEVNVFQKQLNEFKLSCSKLSPDVGTVEVKKKLKEGTEKLAQFSMDYNNKTKLMNTNVNTLKNLLLDSFATSEEAKSIEFRNSDRRYLHLLKSRSLDPVAKRKRDAIQKLYQYVDHQLNQVHEKLEYQWREYINRDKQKLYIPTTETVYKSLKNIGQISRQQKIDYVNMSNYLRSLRKETSANIYSYYSNTSAAAGYAHQSTMDGELSKMADKLLNIDKTNGAEVKSPRKVVSPEKQSALRDLLSRRKVTPIRSSRPKNLTESRFQTSISQDYNNTDVDDSFGTQSSKESAEIGKFKESDVVNKAINAPEQSHLSSDAVQPQAADAALPPSTHRGAPQSTKTLAEGSTSNSFKAPVAAFNTSMTITSTASSDSTIKFNFTDSKPSTSAVPQFTQAQPNSSGLGKTVYEDITPPETPIVAPVVSDASVPTSQASNQSSLRGLFTGGSTSSAFSAPHKSTDSSSSTPSTFGVAAAAKPAQVNKEASTKEQVLPMKPKSSVPDPIVTPSPSAPSNKAVNVSSSNSNLAPLPIVDSITSVQQSSLFPSPTSSAKSSFLPTSFSNVGSSTTKSLPVMSSSTVASTAATTTSVFTFGSLPFDGKNNATVASTAAIFKPNEKATGFKFSLGGTSVSTPTASMFSASTVASIAATKTSPATTLASTFKFSLGDSKEKKDSLVSTVSPATSTTPSTFAFQLPQQSPDESVPTSSSSSFQFKLPESSALKEALTQPEKSAPGTTTSGATAFSFKIPESTESMPQPSSEKPIPTTSSSAFLFKLSESSALKEALRQPDKPALTSTAATTVPSSSGFSFKLPESTELKPVSLENPDVKTEVPSSMGFSFKLQESSQVKIEPIGDAKGAVTTMSTPNFSFILPKTSTEVPSEGTVIEVSAKTGEVKTKVAMEAPGNVSVAPPAPSSSSFSFSLGQTSNSSLFANSSSGSLGFGTAATSTSSPFAQISQQTSVTSTTTPQVTSSTSMFGGTAFASTTKPANTFPSGQAAAGGQLGNMAVSPSSFPSTSTPSIFGGSTQTTPSVFGSSGPKFEETAGLGSAGIFGSPAVSSSSASAYSFGGTSTGFGNTESSGGGGFFSGLGDKPSAENANKNVFGGGSFASVSASSPSIFGNQLVSNTGFGSPQSGGSGSFASNQAGVLQTGFGGFGIQSSPQGQAGFGGSATFGGSPSFGSTAAFGTSKPVFGSTVSPSHVFGSGNDSSFGGNPASVPTFGSLAAQSSSEQGDFGVPTGFGSPAPNTEFGANQSFGSPASPLSSNNSSFSQWRS